VLEQEHRRLVSDTGKESEVQLQRCTALILETLTSWLGELSVDQETYILKRIEEVPDTTDMWLTHRKSRQARLLELLCSSHESGTLEQGLYHWLPDSKTGAMAEYLVDLNEWPEGVEKAVLKIDHVLTRDQLVHFSRKLQRLI
jgi:hypothetical protein